MARNNYVVGHLQYRNLKDYRHACLPHQNMTVNIRVLFLFFMGVGGGGHH